MPEVTQITRIQVKEALTQLVKAGNRLVEAQPNVSWQLKDDGTFLTSLDIEIQRTLRAPLLAIFPECVFVGEEEQAARELQISQPRLVLDPIDGTAPYARGFNYYSISLAVLNSYGEPRAGFVYMPARKRLYAAACEEADRWICYDTLITDSTVEVAPIEDFHSKTPTWRFNDCYVYLGSDSHRRLDMKGFIGKIRALGATASHLALLLDRTPDPAAVILTRYKVWDAIAGLALAHAAGFEIRDLQHPEAAFELSDLVNAHDLPPFVVGESDIVEEIIRQVALIDIL